MATVWSYALTSVFIVSLISFVGAAALVLSHEKLRKVLLLLVSFAVGGLFGDAFIHLLPEAFEAIDDSLAVSLYVLSGVLAFFVLEKFIRWHHCHVTSEEHHHDHSHTPLATINLVGDGVHNLVDGMLIGASFLISIPVGVATTVAVILHEIPSEIGDAGVLLHSGMKPAKVLLYNFLSALVAIVGVAISLWLGSSVHGYAPILSAVTAGGFIYIAGADLVPELHTHRQKLSTSIMQFLAILAGVMVMVLLALFE